MNDNDKHIRFYNELESPFKKSDDDLWEQIAKRTTEKDKTRTLNINWWKYSVAATILLLVGITLFMRFYTSTIVSKHAEHLTHELPDGSEIVLNAASSVKYYPYWWRFKREVNFSGEAFFEVEKGEKFKIISENGITEVLGTSFNIYARNNEYEVFCETGKVKVSSTKSHVKFIIEKGEIAILDNLKKEGKKKKANAMDFVAWKDNKFNFVDEPIQNVLAEFERQYDVKIEFSEDIKGNFFTGYFEKLTTVEESLDLICETTNLTFVQTNRGTYMVLQK